MIENRYPYSDSFGIAEYSLPSKERQRKLELIREVKTLVESRMLSPSNVRKVIDSVQKDGDISEAEKNELLQLLPEESQDDKGKDEGILKGLSKLFKGTREAPKEQKGVSQLLDKLHVRPEDFKEETEVGKLLKNPKWILIHRLLLAFHTKPETQKEKSKADNLFTGEQLMAQLAEKIGPELFKKLMWEQALRDLEVAWKHYEANMDNVSPTLREEVRFASTPRDALSTSGKTLTPQSLRELYLPEFAVVRDFMDKYLLNNISSVKADESDYSRFIKDGNERIGEENFSAILFQTKPDGQPLYLSATGL